MVWWSQYPSRDEFTVERVTASVHKKEETVEEAVEVVDEDKEGAKRTRDAIEIWTRQRGDVDCGNVRI